jgi:hypothetical protein
VSPQDDPEKEKMQEHIEQLKRQQEEFMINYSRMQEEAERLQRAKDEIEEKARKDREESMRLLNK